MTIRPRTLVATSWALAAGIALGSAPLGATPASGGDWPVFRGPGHDAVVTAALGFEARRGVSLVEVWRQPLGSGYSAVSVAEGRAVTTFSDGEQDLAVAFDAATGRELWRQALGPTFRGFDGSDDGVIATLLLTAGRVIGLTPRGVLFALEAATGSPAWSVDLSVEHGARPAYYGFATSPLLAAGHVVVGVATEEGGKTLAFAPGDGALAWSTPSDAISYQTPAPFPASGDREPPLLLAGDTRLAALDPSSGRLLWEAEHGGDLSDFAVRSMVPVWVAPDRVLLTHKRDSAALFHLPPDGGGQLTQVWSTQGLRASYPVPVLGGDCIFGYATRFLTCVDLDTGEMRWKSRQPGDGFPMMLDDLLLVLTKDGRLSLADVSGAGFRELASLEVFDDLAWAAPVWAEGRIYARSHGEIVAVEVREGGAALRAAAGGTADGETCLATGSEFARSMAAVEASQDPGAALATFLTGHPALPIVEDGRLAHFLWRGEAQDVAIATDLLGHRYEQAMRRVAGTDLFYCSLPVEPDDVVLYGFVRDFQDYLADPANPLSVPAHWSFVGFETLSVLALPDRAWPAFLTPLAAGESSGRLESLSVESTHVEGTRTLTVWLPPGYGEGDARYPVLYVHGGRSAREQGRLAVAADRLLGRSLPAAIVVFVDEPEEGAYPELAGDRRDAYADFVAADVVPRIDATYRTRAERSGRLSWGTDDAAVAALFLGLSHPDLFARVAVQSPFIDLPHTQALAALSPDPTTLPAFYVEWGRYDLRSPLEGWGVQAGIDDLERWSAAGSVPLVLHQAPRGFGWPVFSVSAETILTALLTSE